MIKKAVILAGGLGTRLRPLTLETPKALLPVQGRTLTELVLDVLKEAGVEEVWLSIGYLADKIKEYFGDGSKFGVKIHYLVEDEPLGTAGWMKMIEGFDEDIIVVNGDNLLDLDLNDVAELHKRNDALATIALTYFEDVSPYGVADLEGDRIVRFVEKPAPEDAPSNYINTGYYVLSPEVFKILPEGKKLMFETDIFPMIAEKGGLFGFRSSSQWFDTGTLERLEQVNKEWRSI